MTLTEALRLMPPDYRVVFSISSSSSLTFRLIGPVGDVAGVTCDDDYYPAFESAVVQVLRARFDPTYDECEIVTPSPSDPRV